LDALARAPIWSLGDPLSVAGSHPRICQPGPKTEVADWYRQTILHPLLGIPPERFTSQAFWDALKKILPEHLVEDPDGQKYSDGLRYKTYVPIARLLAE
jgi:hypothetical protein